MMERTKDMFCLNGRCMTLKIKRIQLNLKEETTAGGESDVQNPLQNPLIFHQVLSYLNNLEDLKNCRLVHSTWTAGASNVLKKKSIIKISKEFLETSTDDIINVEVLQQLEVFQPQNLVLYPGRFGYFSISEYSNKSWGIVKEQINKMSDGVKSLNFPVTHISEYWPVPAVLQSFTEILNYNFPNLVQLVLGNSDFPWPDPPPPPISSLKRIDWFANCKQDEDERLEGIFKLAPNLESFKVRHDGNEIRNRFGEYAHIFLDYFNNNPTSCPKLKELDLDDLTPMDILALCNLKIQLRSLKLNLPKMGNYQKFQEFLNAQNGRLERLQLVFSDYFYSKVHFTLPCLPKLKKLKLVHNPNSFEMTFEDVDYAIMFPALQNLVIKIKYNRFQSTSMSKDSFWVTCPVYGTFLPVYGKDLDKQVCRTLRVLKLPYPEQPELKMEDNELFGIRERLSIMFPNVHNEHLDIGRARVAEGHPYLPSEPIPVGRCTRSQKPVLLKNGIQK